MKERIVIGYVVVFGLFFSMKAWELQDLEIKKGVVIDYGNFNYGSYYGRTRESRNAIVPYPIARFALYSRPQTMTDAELRKKAEERMDPDTVNIYNRDRMFAEYFKQVKEEAGIHEFKTTEPTGAFFLYNFQEGDSIDVIFYPDRPEEATVYSFFSYWITLPSFAVLVLICFIWTAINVFIHEVRNSRNN
ncbi:MAG: hypothetical protein K0R82_822 [Flavipsychrobacter sp.]|nr:hypothetical protein [Flavipsychrobacter sp.]